MMSIAYIFDYLICCRPVCFIPFSRAANEGIRIISTRSATAVAKTIPITFFILIRFNVTPFPYELLEIHVKNNQNINCVAEIS